MPSAAASYKQKHLNLWINALQPWLSLDGWRKGQTDEWRSVLTPAQQEAACAQLSARVRERFAWSNNPVHPPYPQPRRTNRAGVQL